MIHSALLKRSRWSCIFTVVVTIGMLSGSARAQVPQALFSIATQLPLSGTAYPEFTGDFNGDGVPDLAYITDSNLLKIVLSVGSNAPTTVTTQLNCPITQGFAQISFADVNNDKKLDLVFSCNGYIAI